LAPIIRLPEPGPGGVEVLSDEPCEDWDLAESPSWPTPGTEVRARWQVEASADAFGFWGYVGISARGQIWVVEPIEGEDAERIAIFSPNGRRLGESPIFCGAAFFALAPDGTAFVRMTPRSDSEREDGYILHLDEGGEILHVSRYGGRGQHGFALGPQGRFYLSTAVGVAATCRGRSTQWRRTMREDGFQGWSWVNSDGSMWVSGASHWPTRLDADGSIVQEVALPTDPANDLNELLLLMGTMGIVRVLPDASARGSEEKWLVNVSAPERAPVVLPPRTQIRLDPLGGVWAVNRLAARVDRIFDGDTQFTLENLPFDWFPPWVGTDGSLLAVLSRQDEEPYQLIRILPDGTEAWRVPLVPEREEGLDGYREGGLTAHPNGTVLVAGGRWLIAIDTDFIPHEGDCLQAMCNMRFNSWAGSP
jgi:hypothetical protein